jgi:hypothetical protein
LVLEFSQLLRVLPIAIPAPVKEAFLIKFLRFIINLIVGILK